MKSRFDSTDLVAILLELKDVIGMRLSQVYDIDHKTYLFKLARQEEKCTILVESGIRIHKTDYEWPKSVAPHGFTMKLRKHIKNKRVEAINQLGVDRVVDMQFGINEACYHILIELYDKGNIVLTDNEYTILNILRPRTVGDEDVRLVVREKYPVELARKEESLSNDKLLEILKTVKEGDLLKKVLIPHLMCGPALIEHALLSVGFPPNYKIGKDYDFLDVSQIMLAVKKSEEIMKSLSNSLSSGYIIQKAVKGVSSNQNEKSEVLTFIEFHPMLYLQHKKSPYSEFPTFNKATDHFFSNLESQKIDIKTLQKEKEALKKLENIKKDHDSRIGTLQKAQLEDQRKAQYIEVNLDLVQSAILTIQSAIANQISWINIWNLIQDAQKQGDPIAKSIKGLKLDTNHFTMILYNPFIRSNVDDDDDDDNNNNNNNNNNNSDVYNTDNLDDKPCIVDIDLDLSAYGNARKYYDHKKHAAKKQQKTIESTVKAYKSAEKKAKETLKEVAVTSNIMKARKTFWFEKFLWFISSENYIVIAGRDIQQNELIVKRYMKAGDIYVHAELHGASSVVIKNPSGKPIPPKTLNEAGAMAICYSAAWNEKIVTSAWWVYHHQVTKTAPTGEYLVPGSFMIRGKKNFLPPSHLIVGFGFLFKLDEDSIERHLDERKLKIEEEEEKLNECDTVECNLETEIDLSKFSDTESNSSDIPAEVNKQINDENTSDSLKLNPKDQSDTSSLEKIYENENFSNQSFEESVNFPDTVVKLSNLSIEDTKDSNSTILGNEQQIIHSGKIAKTQKTVNSQSQVFKNQKEKKLNNQEQNPQNQQKRGQKSKLKKIKEKYKDQDEEERQLRMEILASSGNKKKQENDSKKKKREKKENKEMQHQNKQLKQKIQQSNNLKNENIVNMEADSSSGNVATCELKNEKNSKQEQENSDEEVDVTEDILRQNEDEKTLNSLTGCPVSEDTLLFAVPVCAPYSAMQNYKFKVKVVPGSGKRGKAAKTALNIFINDKSTTSREKDLLKSTKEQDICRNMPGKVKLSISAMNKKK
ncbi:nuclear export mediator factor NEMF-like [Centruroides sculpturatus]|uniref:nuclear export mediator factor NEMF-like n=1 Tax=Centruroides sculpturatus TaxID=218467 RepID=UPI000C6D597D|nr:nuclear export mediator factor NEMF-like [Centruroides sculpturatus]